MTQRTIPAGVKLVGEQTITCTGTGKYGINSTCRSARRLIFSVETAPVRMSYASNSTTPAKSTGVLFQKDTTHQIDYNGSALLKFASAQSTAGKVHVIGLRYVGSA